MTSSVTSTRRTPLRVVVAVTAALLLAGCGAVHPGSAAVVGSDSISHDDVDQLAQALCSANIAGQLKRGQAKPDLPTIGARQGALQILVETDLATQFGHAKGATPDQGLLASATGQNEQSVSLVPPSQQETFRAALKEYVEGQLMLIDLGKDSLARSGTATADQSKALAEGHRLLSKWQQGLEIDIDPRFGSYRNGSLVSGDSSLSVAQSKAAVQAQRSNSSSSFATTLPATQKCS